VENSAGDVTITGAGANIKSQQEGILVKNTTGTNTFNNITITGATTAGVSLQNNTGTENFNNLSVTTDGATGMLATNNSQINVTGNSKITSTDAPALKVQNTVATPVSLNTSFTGLTSTDSPTNGVFVSNATGSLQATNVNTTGSEASGVVINKSENLNVNFTNTTVSTADKAGANGIVIANTNTTGGTVNLGLVDVTTAQGTGLQATNSGSKAGPVTVAGGTINATGGPAISSNGSVLDITLTSAASTNSTANGLTFTKSDGTVAIEQTTVTSPAGVGINLDNNVPGFNANFGVTTVTNPGAEGVRIVNSADPSPPTITSFDSLAITSTSSAAGILTRNGGIVNFESPATVQTKGGPAVDLENTTGTLNGVVGSGWVFNALSSTASTSNGVRLVNLNSDFRVLNATNIDSAAGVSVLIADTQPNPPEYTINFNTLNVTDRGNLALSVEGIAGQVIVQNLQVDNGRNVAGDAVRVVNTSSRGPDGGRVYVLAGKVADTVGNGFFAQDSILSVQGTSILNSGANGVFAQAFANQVTTILVEDNVITGSTIDGVRLVALGSAIGNGTINATVTINQIDVALLPINALNLNAEGSIFLSANENFGGVTPPPPGAGNITLDNTFGGFLGISQGSIPQLSVSNNTAPVTQAGVITFNVAVPAPPPPSP
jgi:hypothetical protein